MKISQTLDKILNDRSLYGCGDGNCCIQKNTGMVTNGGCHCLDRADFKARRDIRFYIQTLNEYIRDLERKLEII